MSQTHLRELIRAVDAVLAHWADYGDADDEIGVEALNALRAAVESARAALL